MAREGCEMVSPCICMRFPRAFFPTQKGIQKLAINAGQKDTHTHTQDQKERQAGRSGRRHVRPSESEKRAKIVYLSASHPAVKLAFHTSASDGGDEGDIRPYPKGGGRGDLPLQYCVQANHKTP